MIFYVPRHLILILLLLLPFHMSHAQSNRIHFQSPETQVSLLELYTSEGCSSCPPAEAWLGGLKQAPGLWMNFVPVAFHVDYWDYLGWRDPWSSASFTDRQRSYAATWRSQSVYTPGFVLNGKEWRDWPGQKTGPVPRQQDSGILTVSSVDTNHWTVAFRPAQDAAGDFTAQLVLLGSGLRSEVKAGENRGRKLEHDFVALKTAKVALTKQPGIFAATVTLDARNLKDQPALACWITAKGGLEPIQAVGGWMVSSPKASP